MNYSSAPIRFIVTKKAGDNPVEVSVDLTPLRELFEYYGVSPKLSLNIRTGELSRKVDTRNDELTISSSKFCCSNEYEFEDYTYSFCIEIRPCEINDDVLEWIVDAIANYYAKRLRAAAEQSSFTREYEKWICV